MHTSLVGCIDTWVELERERSFLKISPYRAKLHDVYQSPFSRITLATPSWYNFLILLSKKTTAIIQQFASSRSEIQGACRFFNNAAVRPEMSFRALAEECRRVVKDKSICATA